MINGELIFMIYNTFTDDKQRHDVSIVFKGNFDQVLDYLRLKGVEIDFIPPGLNGSGSILIVGDSEAGKFE
jgi:hypothetical protein